MIDKELVAKARSANLPEYFLRNGFKVDKVRDNKGIQYKVDGYGGLYVKDNMFYQFSTNKSGNAVECLTEVLGYSFKDAVNSLTDGTITYSNSTYSSNTPVITNKIRKVEMPERCANVSRVYAYLLNSRGIEQTLVADLLQKKLLYQDKNGNAIFVHRDSEGNKIGGEVQGTSTYKRFKGVVGGTGRSAFEYIKGVPEKVCLFESAIDMLSYIQMNKNENNVLYASMAGLKKEIALDYLKKGLVVDSKVDNDVAGRRFNKVLKLEYHLTGKFNSVEIKQDKEHEYVYAKVSDDTVSLNIFPSKEDYDYYKPQLQKGIESAILGESTFIKTDSTLINENLKDWNDLLKKNLQSSPKIEAAKKDKEVSL